MTKATLKNAEEYCAAHKHRLTQPRLEVLKIIAGSRKPLGAYEVLERLGRVMDNPKPPTAYRAIDFWKEHGFIHRIESLNAYVSCGAGHYHKGSQFMICDSCGTVIEAHLCELPAVFRDALTRSAFAPSSWNLEIHGACKNCI